MSLSKSKSINACLTLPCPPPSAEIDNLFQASHCGWMHASMRGIHPASKGMGRDAWGVMHGACTQALVMHGA
eukprot:11842-Chlamydomonas_euryale.AAC.3